MQTAAINNRTQAPIAAKSRASEELSQEFSELLNALDNSADSSASSGSTDAEMVNILADQLSTTVISQATAQQLNQKEKSREDKDAPKSEAKTTSNQNLEVSNDNTSNNQQQDTSAKLVKAENVERADSQVRNTQKLPQAIKSPVEGASSEVAPVQTLKADAQVSSSAVADNEVTAAPAAEMPAAEVAVRNIMNAQSQNVAAPATGRVEASAAQIAPQMPNLGIEARTAKVQPNLNTDSLKTEVIAKNKEVAQRADEGKNSKAQGKKDFQLSVQKIEDALKEAVAAKDGKSISIKLEPSALGAVKVDVTLKDGGLYARVVVESPQVGNMMRERTQEIVENLKKLGLNVDSINVFIGNGGQGSDYRDQLPTPSKNNAQSLRVLMNDASALDARSLAPGLKLGKDLNSGWIA
jgi:flagellar hook-length control protein FliK